jgi:hypothetical protein
MLKTKTYRPEEIRDPNTGKWINSKVFCEEGIKFMKNGYYCPEPIGSPSYKEYWDEQLRRCKEGYEVAGHKITGHHYEYLNFTQIEDSKRRGILLYSERKQRCLIFGMEILIISGH